MPDNDIALEYALKEWKRDYRKRLENAEEKGKAIGNRYPWQTRLAVEVLLKKAAREQLPIRILCGGIPQDFYDEDVTALLQACLKAGCEIKIAVWHDSTSAISPKIRQLSQKYPGQFKLLWSGVKGDVAKHLLHFLLVGDRAYRQEAVHEDFVDQTFNDFSPEIPARIHFNDPDGLKQQLGLFEDVWSVCEPLPDAA